MSFFDKDEIAKIAAERQQEEVAARKAAQEKKVAEEAAKDLANREMAALMPFVREALEEFVGLAKQLGTKSSPCKVYVDALFGEKTKYGRKKVEADVALWHLFSGRWANGHGTVAIDGRGRTFVEELDERTKDSYITYDRYEVPREMAAEVIAESIRTAYCKKTREYREGCLLEAQRAEEAVRNAFMEILKKK